MIINDVDHEDDDDVDDDDRDINLTILSKMLHISCAQTFEENYFTSEMCTSSRLFGGLTWDNPGADVCV